MLIQNIKKKAELEKILGKVLMNSILNNCVKPDWKRMPTSIFLEREKPKFFLDDSSSLTAYVVDLTNGDVLSTRYCGSGDSTANFSIEQLSEGGTTPDNIAVLFIERFWAGSKSGWTLTIVSNNIQKFVA
jgi:hypothetical protein